MKKWTHRSHQVRVELDYVDLMHAAKATVEDMAAALHAEAEEVMTISKDIYCPVVTGNLRSTGTVVGPFVSDREAKVHWTYGGLAAPYAVTVHERPPNIGQGKVKYLEIPVRNAEKGMEARLAARLRGAWRYTL